MNSLNIFGIIYFEKCCVKFYYHIFNFTASKSALTKLGVRPEWFTDMESPISIAEILEDDEYPDVSLLNKDISFCKSFFEKKAWEKIEKSRKCDNLLLYSKRDAFFSTRHEVC